MALLVGSIGVGLWALIGRSEQETVHRGTARTAQSAVAHAETALRSAPPGTFDTEILVAASNSDASPLHDPSPGTLTVDTSTDRQLILRLKTSLPDTFSVHPKQPLSGDVATTGDATLDESCSIKGRPGYLAAVLDEETREALMRAVGVRGLTIQSRIISITESMDANTRVLRRAVALMVTLAKALQVPTDERRTLLDNALNEKNSGVGIRAAYELWRSYPDSAEAKQLDREGLTCQKPWLAIATAQRFAGQDSVETLLAIVSNSRIHGVFRVRALGALVDKGLNNEVQASLAALVPRSSGELFASLIKALAGTPMRPSVDVLRTRAHSLGLEARMAIIEIATVYGPGAVPLLNQLLYDRRESLTLKAIEALGRLPSMESVAALERFTANSGVTKLRDAAKDTIKEIQEYLDRNRGSLSLVDDGALEGALSTSEADSDAGLALSTRQDP